MFSDRFSAYGCDLDFITLSCSIGAVINVASASYGQYGNPCSDCCLPNATSDCTEVMWEIRPSDWLALKYTCDNQTSCEYRNLGSLLENCNDPFYADYLTIDYDCLGCMYTK